MSSMYITDGDLKVSFPPLVAVVTGASTGIGEAVYSSLQGCFSRVIGVSRHGPDIYKDVREIINDSFSLLEPKEKCWLLVNAAGVMPFEDEEDEEDKLYSKYKYVMDTNFWGTYNVIRNLEPHFISGGCIINIASVSGVVHDADLPIYSASKAAVISLTKSLAKKYASKNIRVNCISPGFFYPTNLVPGPPPKELTDQVPLKYAEHPDELVRVVKMIYQTKYMTGANIVVDGGLSA